MNYSKEILTQSAVLNRDRENVCLWLEELAFRALDEIDSDLAALEKSGRIIRYLEELREK